MTVITAKQGGYTGEIIKNHYESLYRRSIEVVDGSILFRLTSEQQVQFIVDFWEMIGFKLGYEVGDHIFPTFLELRVDKEEKEFFIGEPHSINMAYAVVNFVKLWG